MHRATVHRLTTLAIAACSLAIVAPTIAAEQRPADGAASGGVRRYTIEELMATDSLGGLSFSPDNRTLLFTSNRTGAANLYSIPVTGGVPRALTSSQEPLGAIGYFPADERILYAGDEGGNELTHLFVRETDGSTRDVTPGMRLKARFVAWAPDDASFFAATNERDARFFDLYEYDAKSYSRRLLFQNDASYQIEAVSPDRSRVALSRIFDNANTDAVLYDTRTRALEVLTAQPGDIVEDPQFFSRDGKGLFLTSDAGREFQYLVRLNLADGTRRTVFQTDWDVLGAGLSADGRYLVVSVNENARTRIHLFDAATLERLSMPDVGAGTIESFAIADGAPLAAMLKANGDEPGDVSIVDLRRGVHTPLLRSLSPQVAQKDLVAGEVVRFRSYDGLTIPGVLYLPKGAAKRHDLPAVVSVHGGPGGESRIGYKPVVQYLVNHGYVVYEINNRGSAGSGKTFFHLDDHRHGDADLDDVVASRQMLVDTGHVDPRRIAVMGQSYGGYMTLAALTFRPQAFAVGVDIYGVANWPRLLQNTPAWWEDLRRYLATEVGDVAKDGDYLRGISPFFHAQRIQRPLLVLQGANDPRVLQIESDDIVAKVRANGVPVEYVIFPDEGHGFRKKPNQIVAWRSVKAFLDEHLQADAADAGSAQAGARGAPALAAGMPPAQRLPAFFERVFERDLARSPMRQSRLGIQKAQDRWDDISEEDALESAALVRDDLEALSAFDPQSLDPASRLSLRLFERSARERLKGFEWRRHGYLLTQMGGLHRSVATILLNNHPIAERADAQAYVARLEGVKALMAQLVVELERQEAADIRPPRFVYGLVLGEAENLLEGRPFEAGEVDSPLFADLRGKLAKLDDSKMPAAERASLLSRGEAALLNSFAPGYRGLIDHLRKAQASATDADGIWKLPNGAAYYRYALESYTTLPVTPEELHDLGLREVARLHEEMRAIVERVGFQGTLQDFFTHVREDASFYYADTQAGREEYLRDARALLEEVHARQGEVLGIKPKAGVEVRAVEAWREKSAAKAFYQNPAQDGSRPGIFFINLYDMRAAPRYQLPVVLYHETIPGHHVETAVAYELPDLPRFRKFAGFAAFSEGWGLYSERVAHEMGLYRDPYQDFGRLSLELMRAARLVVDTGLHHKRWTRAQAVAYLDRNMPGSNYDNQREIDRYIVLPGQATAYAVGMLKIVALRERAQRELGARFDVRAFHDVVLGSGPLPLPILAENVEAWIRSRAGP